MAFCNSCLHGEQEKRLERKAIKRNMRSAQRFRPNPYKPQAPCRTTQAWKCTACSKVQGRVYTAASKRLQELQSYRCESGLHDIRPAGHMGPAKAFLAARESFLNCRKCCESSTSNKLSLQNFFHTTTKSLHRNERDFCRPREIYGDNLALRAF